MYCSYSYLYLCIAAKCAAGKYAKSGATYECVDCPRHFYRPTSGAIGVGECIACEDDKITNTTGTVNKTSCMVKPDCANTGCPDSNHICTDTGSDSGPLCTCPSAFDAIGDECRRKL